MYTERRLLHRHTPSFSPNGTIALPNNAEVNGNTSAITDVTNFVRSSITGTCNIVLNTTAAAIAELSEGVASAAESLPATGNAAGRTINSGIQTIWQTAKGIFGK